MMRKLIALASAATHKPAPHASGTISSRDAAAKQATIKDAAGKEISFSWNDKTKVTGTLKVGERASVSYTKDKAGKIWANHVTVAAKTASTKPSTSK
jgi:hypothetical protein